MAMPRVEIRSFAVCSTALICSIYGMAHFFNMLPDLDIWFFVEVPMRKNYLNFIFCYKFHLYCNPITE